MVFNDYYIAHFREIDVSCYFIYLGALDVYNYYSC
jgi:hypothetical protein